MKTGIGGLGWRPADFWDSTLTEFFLAIKGNNEVNGADDEVSAGPTKDELATLVARYGNKAR